VIRVAVALASAVTLAAVAALPSPAAAAPPLQGVALGLFHDGDDADGMLDDIAATGANAVSIPVLWKQADVHSDAVARADGDVTISDAVLIDAIRGARRRGLSVMLFPIVDVAKKRAGQWRGTIAPRDPKKWWASYETFILHYARIAADEEVAVFSVGSELGSTESWRDRWIHLVAAVEKIYGGELVYSANWDHYQHVSFFERVDLVGISAYPELTRDDDASEKDLARAWSAERKKLVAFAEKIDRPLLITEVGWPSRDGGAVRPWDYTTGGAVDVEEQRRCYAAFIRAWKDEESLAGVFFWIWSGEGGPKDRGYTPRGKPAERELRTFYAH
jgi:hypothetical protein